MAGADYNRKRYYTRSQQLSEQRDDLKQIFALKAEVRELKAEIDRLTAELKVARGE